LEIVGSLGSSLPDEKRMARERLERMGKGRALKLLLSALGDERWRIRKTATDVLAVWEDSGEAVNSLVELLGDDSDTTRRNAAVEVLTRIGNAATDQLVLKLRDPDPHVRKLLVDVLGAVADPKAEKELIATLSEEDENVRMAAVEALSNFKGSGAARALLRLLSGPDVPMRFYAMESLGKMDILVPLDEIRPLVHQRILRRAALDVLGNCPESESIEFLLEALKDSLPSNRLAAVRSLGKLYREYPELRGGVEKNIAALRGEEKALSTLLESLDNSNLDIQRTAVQFLGILGHPASAKALIEAARDSRMQPEAIEALKKVVQQSQISIKTLLLSNDPIWDLMSDFEEIERPAAVRPPSQRASTMAASSMTDNQFKSFRDYLQRIYGIYFNEDMKYILERRLGNRLEALGMKDFSIYLANVMSPNSTSAEIGEAINILTTNETYFFREKFQLSAFREEILPELHKYKQDVRKLSIWSAGCSSGEEVYTIAILVDECGLFDGWEITILGGDISNRMIRKARNGIYSATSFRETPADYIKKYFEPLDNGDYKLIDRIQRMVKFREINLADKKQVLTAGIFDVVFCRNVIIYFDMGVKRKVIDHLFSVLEPAGYLLLGHAESLLNISTQFDLIHLKNDMVYRKPAEAGVSR